MTVQHLVIQDDCDTYDFECYSASDADRHGIRVTCVRLTGQCVPGFGDMKIELPVHYSQNYETHVS